jgi:hypothetical protein
MDADSDLHARPGAAAHLIHGSSEGRFVVTYSPGPGLSRSDVEGVNFSYLSSADAVGRFRFGDGTPDGICNDIDGRPFTLIRRPGLGLWQTAA